jgi:four helix bundle protein
MELGKLDIYKLSVELSDMAWEIFNLLPKPLQFSIGDQMIRSIDSIGANIAEGYGRFHYKDSIKFYYNARGSLWESKHWLYLLHKRKLITRETFEKGIDLLNMLGKKLNNFIQRIKQNEGTPK